jgi:hypothetical protein
VGDIGDCAGRWLLEKVGLYSPISGIINNIAESVTRVVKSKMDEASGGKLSRRTLDRVFTALQRLTDYHNEEINRGMHQTGSAHFSLTRLHHSYLPL